MSLFYQVLGSPGSDNALLVTLDPGHARYRLLFDCGGGCLESLRFGEIQDIDYVFFSHLHMDHVGGFDRFFRINADRNHKPNLIYGPPQSSRIMQHRFEGYLWNMVEDTGAQWWVCDVHEDHVERTRFDLSEAFSVAHHQGSEPFDGLLLEDDGFSVEALTLDHHTPSLGYIIREKPHIHVSDDRLARLGLEPGPWLQQLKEAEPGVNELHLAGKVFQLAQLRELLLTESPGQSIAYLTDFLLDEDTHQRLAARLKHCDTIVCESQYHPNDQELAVRNFHLTSTQAAGLAAEAEAQELILIHLSNRYTVGTWKEMLLRAQRVFRRTRFPDHWARELTGPAS